MKEGHRGKIREGFEEGVPLRWTAAMPGAPGGQANKGRGAEVTCQGVAMATKHSQPFGNWTSDIRDRERNVADTEACDLNCGRQCRPP